MQNNNKPARSAKQSRVPPRKDGKKVQRSAPRKSVGAAQFRDNAKFVGMKDLVAHRVSWLTGSIYVGNGTLGATDAVLFRINAGTGVVNSATGGSQIPILGADPILGVNYVSDIEKHYARKVIRSMKLRLMSVQPSTANSMVAVVAPVRGCGASGDVVTVTTATSPQAYGDVISMSGSISFPSYADKEIDLTPYIAGGFGARQNEFTINRDGDTAGTQWGAGTMDLTGIAPAAFVVTGVNTTAALRGTNTHYVVIDMVVDFLDFIAGSVNPNPIGFLAKASREDLHQILRSLLQSPQKEVRETPLVRNLVKALSLGESKLSLDL